MLHTLKRFSRNLIIGRNHLRDLHTFSSVVKYAGESGKIEVCCLNWHLSSIFWNSKSFHQDNYLDSETKILHDEFEDEDKLSASHKADDDLPNGYQSINHVDNSKEKKNSTSQDENILMNSFLSKKITKSRDPESLLHLFNQYYNPLNKENTLKILLSLATHLSGRGDKGKLVDICNPQIKTLWNRVHRCYFYYHTNQLLQILRYFHAFNIPHDHIYVIHLLKELKYRIDTMTGKNIKYFEGSLKDIKNDEATKLLYALPICISCRIASNSMDDMSLTDLTLFFSFCVWNDVKGTDILVKAINQFEIEDSDSAMYNIWRICDLMDNYHTRKWVISEDGELNIEILAKRCLSYMTEHIQSYNIEQLCITMRKISHSYNAGSHYLYHEKFLEAISKVAIQGDWHFKDLERINRNQIVMRYMNLSLITKIVKIISDDNSLMWNSMKAFPLITAVSCLKLLNTEFGDIIQKHPVFNDVKSHILPHSLKVLELLNINCVPNSVIEQLFEENYIFENFMLKKRDKLLSQVNSRQFALLKFRLEQMKHPVCQNISPNVSQLLKVEVLKIANENKTPILMNELREVLGEHFEKVVSNVIYKDSIILDNLLVLDIDGLPIEVNHFPNQHSTPFELLDIPEGSKKICFQWIVSGLVYRPDNYLHGPSQLLKTSLRDDGFEVIFSMEPFEDGERLFKLKNDYLSVCSR